MQYVNVDAEILQKHPDAVALEVVGTCMEPAVPEGSMLLVDEREAARPGCIVAVRLPYVPLVRNLDELDSLTLFRVAWVDRVEGEQLHIHNGEGANIIDRSILLGVVVAIQEGR